MNYQTKKEIVKKVILQKATLNLCDILDNISLDGTYYILPPGFEQSNASTVAKVCTVLYGLISVRYFFKHPINKEYLPALRELYLECIEGRDDSHNEILKIFPLAEGEKINSLDDLIVYYARIYRGIEMRIRPTSADTIYQILSDIYDLNLKEIFDE